jgi:hypothetical protein
MVEAVADFTPVGVASMVEAVADFTPVMAGITDFQWVAPRGVAGVA